MLSRNNSIQPQMETDEKRYRLLKTAPFHDGNPFIGQWPRARRSKTGVQPLESVFIVTARHKSLPSLRKSFVLVHNMDLPFVICHLWLQPCRAVLLFASICAARANSLT